MSDDEKDWYSPSAPEAPPRRPKPGDRIWEFVRECDWKHFACELRFNGGSYGWEAQILEGGESLYSHGAFVTRALAAFWAEDMRADLEKGGA